MSNNTNNIVVPWIDSCEFEEVYKALFHGNISRQKFAVERIGVWKSRSSVPVAIDSTSALFRVVISHVDVATGRTEDALRNAYSLAIIRFVNHITEKGQVKQYMRPVHRLAGELGVPAWIVNLRHDATHGSLPSLDLLKTAADFCIKWLKEEFWNKQIEGYSNQVLTYKEQTYKGFNEVEDLLKQYKELKQSVSSKKKSNKKLTSLLNKIQISIVYNRESAINLLAEKIKESIREDLDEDSLLSLWEPVLNIYHQSCLSLLLLKCLPVTEEFHAIISSILSEISNRGLTEDVVKYLDLLFSQPDHYSVISLVHRLDLHCLLPEDKANQLTRLLECDDGVIPSDRVYGLNDLKVNTDNSNERVESPWKLCTDIVTWGEIPIGQLPESSITYNNIMLCKTSGEDMCTDMGDDGVQEGIHTTNTKPSVESMWSHQDLDRIQNLIQVY